MTLPYKWSVPTAPPTWEKRVEVGHAIRALAALEEERLRQRRVEIAALRRDFEALRRDCSLLAQTLRQTCGEQVLIELRAELRKYTGRGPRGENRLVIDFGSGGIYYTNHHYANFYPVDLVTSGN